ncbi:MAG TPA: tail fiber domain-containing protein, partial [Segetibacter sp.]
DAKLKKNIKEVDNAIDIINRLQPKNYEYRKDGSFGKMHLPNGKHYGLLAQDLEKVLPDLVKETHFNSANATHNKAATRLTNPLNAKAERALFEDETKEEIIDANQGLK